MLHLRSKAVEILVPAFVPAVEVLHGVILACEI